MILLSMIPLCVYVNYNKCDFYCIFYEEKRLKMDSERETR